MTGAAGLDAAAAAAGAVRLVRTGGSVVADLEPRRVVPFVRELAYAGTATIDVGAEPAVDSTFVPALARGLAALPGHIPAVDVLFVEAVPLARATRIALGRPLSRWLPGARARRERCRALLRDEERLLAWGRRVWIARAGLADPRVRAVLRPIVFDRGSLVRVRLVRTVARSDGAIARWAAS